LISDYHIAGYEYLNGGNYWKEDNLYGDRNTIESLLKSAVCNLWMVRSRANETNLWI